MRLGSRNGRGIHRVERFELPDACPRIARSPGQQTPDDSSGGSVGSIMSAFAADFKTRAQQITRDLRHRQLIQTALRTYEMVRDRTKSTYQDWPAARQAAAETKWEAINHLDRYLTELVGKLESRDTKVHWATTDRQVHEIILAVI